MRDDFDDIIEKMKIDDEFKDALRKAFKIAEAKLEFENENEFEYEIVPENYAKVVAVTYLLHSMAQDGDIIYPAKIEINGYIVADIVGIDIDDENEKRIRELISNSDRISIDATTDAMLHIEIVIGNVQRKKFK